MSFLGPLTFTDTDNTLLQTHDTNWKKVGSGTNLVIWTNQLYVSSSNAPFSSYYNDSVEPSSADYEVQATFNGMGNPNRVPPFIGLRHQGAGSTFCYLVRYSGTAAWRLYKKGAAAEAVEVQSYSGYSLTQDRTVVLRATGTDTVNLTVFVDGAPIITYIDSSSAYNTGYPSVGAYYSNRGNGDELIDNFSATYITGSAAAAAVLVIPGSNASVKAGPGGIMKISL